MENFGLRGYDGRARLDAPEPPAPKPAKGSRAQPTANGSDLNISQASSLVRYHIVDNSMLLSGIRRALGPELLSRLPALAELSSRPVRQIQRSDLCPLAIEIGALVAPNSPNLLILIFATIGTRGQAPLGVFFTPSRNLTDIISREFADVEGVESTNFFQDWEIFRENVYLHRVFLIPHCWDDLKDMVTYCLLLVWEMEQPTVWNPIPTRIDIADILEDLCRLNPKKKDRDANYDNSSYDEGYSNDRGDASLPSDATPIDRRQGTATGRNGNATEKPYSLPREVADRLTIRPSAHVLAAINRRKTNSISYGARKRQALQSETKETVEEPSATQLLEVQQHTATMNTTRTQDTVPDPDVIKRIRSFKPQYRRPEDRAPTPPRPSYEPISPWLSPTSAMLLPPVPIDSAATLSLLGVSSDSGDAAAPQAIQTADARLQMQSHRGVSGAATRSSSKYEDRPTPRQDESPIASEAKDSATETFVANPDVQSAEDASTVHDGSLNFRKRKAVDEEAGDEATSPFAEQAKGETSATQSVRPRKSMTFEEYLAYKKAKLDSEMPESTGEVNETKAEVDDR